MIKTKHMGVRKITAAQQLNPKIQIGKPDLKFKLKKSDPKTR
jgi:hypothetical protein